MKNFPARPVPKDAKLLPENAKKVFQGKIFSVYQWPQTMFDGAVATFEMLQRTDSVLVVPVMDNGKIWLIDEEQPGSARYKMGLPGGRVDDGEAVIDAVKRECEEEIGVRFRDWYYIESVQPHRKIDWYVHVFVAKNPIEFVETRHDKGENIAVIPATYEEFLRHGDEVNKIPAFRECETLEKLFARAEFLE